MIGWEECIGKNAIKEQRVGGEWGKEDETNGAGWFNLLMSGG